MVHILMKRFPN